MDKQFIKERYYNIRNAHNLSARKLSIELGQSSEYINQIETGKNMPSIDGLINFCDYFNITLTEFFDENITYPVQYKELLSQLNKLDTKELELIIDLIKAINSKK
ncbi:MAG: helix-turn-helix transcriptional regulator [Clostridiales bacterium]|nr:helix-turn-helix transcriptional regulator [Clostridiales bacterium]